jgi:hypothetical protein
VRESGVRTWEANDGVNAFCYALCEEARAWGIRVVVELTVMEPAADYAMHSARSWKFTWRQSAYTCPFLGECNLASAK